MTGADPIVRRAQVTDAAAIAALQVRSWKVAYRDIVPAAFLDDLTETAWLGRWTDQLEAPGRTGIHQLVSTDARDGSPRAVAACGPAMAPADPADPAGPAGPADPRVELTGQLYVLYTDPDCWGHGHGSALLRRVHELLAADEYTSAMLWVAADNDRSIAFYEHHGWVKDGASQREEVAGTPFDEIRMRRGLAD